MDRRSRLGLGAALGAGIALALHPASRPFLLLCFTNAVVPTSVPLRAGVPVRLGDPRSREDAAIWMLVGAQKIRARLATPEELKALLEVAGQAETLDPDNAYWRQMSAVFLDALGAQDAAEKMWRRASTLARWDDLQTADLVRRVTRLARQSGASMSWQQAYMYGQRSDAPAAAVMDYVRKAFGIGSRTRAASLETRYATLINGKLIRDGARSVAIGNIGADIVEFSSHSKPLTHLSSIRKLILAKFEFKEALRKAGLVDQALNSEVVFNDNDGWTALTQRGQAREPTAAIFVGTVLLATVPSALLMSALVGAFILGFSWMASKFPSWEAAVSLPWSLLWSMAFGAVVGIITQFPLAGLAAGLCGLFVSMTPKRERTKPPTSRGPLFAIAIATLALSMIGVVTAFVIGLSRPALFILPTVGVPGEYLAGSSMYVGLAALVLGALLLVAPLWAFAQRVRTYTVLRDGLARFGADVFAISLVLSVVLCPLCVLGDRKVGETVRELFLNEPLHYLRQ